MGGYQGAIAREDMIPLMGQSPLPAMGQALNLAGLLQDQSQQRQMFPEQLEAARQRDQMGALQLQAAQQEQRDNQVLQGALQQSGGDMGKALGLVYGKVSPNSFLNWQAEHVKVQDTLSQMDEREFKTQQDRHNRLAGLYSAAMSMPDDQYAQSWPAIKGAAAAIDPSMQLPDQPVPKQQLQALGLAFMTQDQYLKAEDAKRQQAELAEKVRHDQAVEAENDNKPPTESELLMKAAQGDPDAVQALQLKKSLGNPPTSYQAEVDPTGKITGAFNTRTGKLTPVDNPMGVGKSVVKAQQPTADEKRRGDLANNLMENFSQLEDIINRRPELFGPIAGRETSLKSAFGSNDPDIGALETIKHQIGMAQISAHGMRSAQGIADAGKSILNNFNSSPAALRGAINAARNSVGTFLQDAQRTASQLPSGGGKVIDRATATQFYRAAGGDPAKARQLALQAGWKVQ